MAEKLYRNKDWLHEQYWGQDKSITEMAHLAGCGSSTITHWMQKFDIPCRTAAEGRHLQAKQKGGRYRDPKWLHEMYWNRNKTTTEMARLAGYGSSTITHWMDTFHIPRRGRTEARIFRQDKQYKDHNWLYEMYQVQGKSATEIADLAGCGKSTILYWLKKHNIYQPCKRDSKALYRNKTWLNEMYWIEKMSINAIAQIVDCDPSRILYWMNRFNIPRRSSCEGLDLLVQDGTLKQIMSDKWANPEYHKRMLKAIRSGQDSIWYKNVTAALRHRFEDPQYCEEHAERLRELNRKLGLKKRNQGKMTKIEAICHATFESLELDFIFEKYIHPYRVDFLFPSHNVIVESYGDHWHTLPDAPKHDAERKQYLEASGYTVLEWWGKDIKADIYKLIDDELLPLLDQPSRIERPPRGVSKPYRGPHGWKSATQLYLFGEGLDNPS